MCGFIYNCIFFFKWQVKMLTCWQSQSKSGLQAWWGQQKNILTALSFFSSLPPLLLSLSQHSHHFLIQPFFPPLLIWSAFIWDWGRETVTGWNAWKNAAFHVRKDAAPGMCVCVCVCLWRVWLLKPKICRLRSFDRLKVDATTLELILN